MERGEYQVDGSGGPQIRAETWFSLALATSIISLCLFIIVAIWVFSGPSDQLQPRAQAFTPFGAALIGVVTFCTIAWRGVLNTQQLLYQATQIAHQAEQLQQARRQNDAKDEENLAKLLMDGTKLLGEEKQSHVLAGVAALQAVVTSPKGAFAPQAMDILVDQIESTYQDPGYLKVFDAAREAVGLGASVGRTSTRTLRLKYTGEVRSFAYAIRGVASLHYENATIESVEYGRLADQDRVFFQNCLIEDCVIIDRHRNFKNCFFESCEIKTMSGLFLRSNSFELCDFSGARYSGGRPFRRKGEVNPLNKLKNEGNWFNSENPIVGGAGIDWAAYIDRHEPMDIILDFDDDEEEPSAYVVPHN